MRKFLSTVFATIVSVSLFAQTDSTESTKKKFVPSLATIQTIDGRKTKGWFYKMNDENIYLLPAQKNKKYFRSSEFLSPNATTGAFNIQASKINTIALQKRNAGLKGTLIGLGTGIVAGAMAGFISGDDPVTPYTGDLLGDIVIAFGNSFAMTAEQKAVAGAITFGITGAITGFIIGKIAKKKFIIGGKKEAYNDLQAELMRRLIIK